MHTRCHECSKHANTLPNIREQAHKTTCPLPQKKPPPRAVHHHQRPSSGQIQPPQAAGVVGRVSGDSKQDGPNRSLDPRQLVRRRQAEEKKDKAASARGSKQLAQIRPQNGAAPVSDEHTLCQKQQHKPAMRHRRGTPNARVHRRPAAASLRTPH